MLADPDGARSEIGPVFAMVEEIVHALRPMDGRAELPPSAIVAISDLVNAFASVGTPLPQIVDEIARSLLADLAPERLSDEARVRAGLAALAFGDLELARRFDTDKIGPLHAFLTAMTGERDRLMYQQGATTMPIVERALANGVDAVTLLWLGRLTYRDAMGKPAGQVVRETRGYVERAIRRDEIRQQAEAQDREAAADAAIAFPHGALVANGAFRITDLLRGIGSQKLWRAVRVQDGRQALVAIDWKLSRIPADSLRPVLARRAVNVELAYVGEVDDPPEDHSHWLCVEIPIQGTWLPDLVGEGVGPLDAIDLARSAGRLLAQALADGTVFDRVRPEYMWGVRDGGRLKVTAVSDRSEELFRRKTYDLVTRPPFEREYAAPEVWLSAPSDRSLVYSLAKMLVDWAGGTPASISALLERALSEDPAHRPGLDAFLGELDAI